MEYTVRDAGHYLIVEMAGAPSEPAVREMLKAMAASSSGGQVIGALVEVRVAYGLDLVSSKDLVLSLPSLGFPRSYRIAVLLLDEVASQAAQFAEDVAVNRGLAVRVFRDREQALGWLEAGLAP
jgi:hypothetical protein